MHVNNRINFKIHHVAISVRDLEVSEKFYAYFGFELITEWTARDNTLKITHMAQSDGYILELFTYSLNSQAEALSSEVGNNLERVGLKHIAFNVPSLDDVKARMASDGIGGMTDTVRGQTIDYFFLPDPDGNWIEILEDRRNVSPSSPLITEL